MSFLLLILLITSSLQAGILTQEECTDTDIRDTNPKIKNNRAMLDHFTFPQDQDSVGWCYAFAAADMMAAEIGTPISSLHTSAILNKSYQMDPDESKAKFNDILESQEDNPDIGFNTVFSGGYIITALKEMMKNKVVCKNEDLPFDAKHPKATRDFILRLESLKLYRIPAKDLVCDELKSYLPELKKTNQDLGEIAENILKKNLNISLEELAEKNCHKRMLVIPKLPVTRDAPALLPKDEFNGFIKSMNSALESGKPIGIEYDIDKVTSMKGKHASVIIGRRWSNGQCEYRVRNSWGQNCSYYNEGIKCNKSDGSFWMPDTGLKTIIDAVTFIPSH